MLANAFFAERLADADEVIGVLVAVWARLVGVLLLLHHEHPHDDLKPFGKLLETFRCLALNGRNLPVCCDCVKNLLKLTKKTSENQLKLCKNLLKLHLKP